MRALVNTQANDVQLQQRPMPELVAGEVVLKIEDVGICGSDMHACHGRTNCDYVGGGYRVPTPGMVEAVTLLAQTEGILLDPVHSGRSRYAARDFIGPE